MNTKNVLPKRLETVMVRQMTCTGSTQETVYQGALILYYTQVAVCLNCQIAVYQRLEIYCSCNFYTSQNIAICHHCNMVWQNYFIKSMKQRCKLLSEKCHAALIMSKPEAAIFIITNFTLKLEPLFSLCISMKANI